MYEDEDEEVPQGPMDDRLKHEKEKDELIFQLQSILNAGHSVDNENSLIKLVQNQRRLLLDIATQTFIHKPNNPKLLDSINTLLGQMEKTVRDDRKERLRDRELEDNRANFATFVTALNEITAGKIVMPTFETHSINLDPLSDDIAEPEDPDEAIRDEELHQGRQILDSKKIEEQFSINTETPAIYADPETEDEEDFDPEM